MNALLFPGQGSQIVGMGSEFYENFNIVKTIFKEADEKLNYNISKIILEGPENELQLTQNTQPAILTVSYSIFKEKNLEIYDANTWRPYCHVKDFARLIYQVLNTEKSMINFQVFNSGGDINNFTKKFLYETASIFSFPQNKIGEGIKLGSFIFCFFNSSLYLSFKLSKFNCAA